MTPNKRWLAVAERAPSGKGTVTVYDLAILKKRKVLVPLQDSAAARVRHLPTPPPPPPPHLRLRRSPPRLCLACGDAGALHRSSPVWS